MPTIYIDRKPYTVREGISLLQALLELDFNLPYFCWHPAMGSVGACRQCAIKQFRDENDTRGRIVMACMTPVADGAYISVFDPEAVEFRAGITEYLMVNHPHDCPVCDEGGECHLQDMTVMTGHNYRRYRWEKRTFYNQDLGPFVNHEMNRCIQCYRCVRFYRDYAGGRDFNAFSLHDTVYFGRAEDGVLESEFSGNLVEVCPTGVFTDKTLKKHYTRKWDLQTAPSICVNCSVGCNTIPGERYGSLRRIRNRYNGDVNGYFLCDRGRYGYEFVNSPTRIRKARLAGAAEPVTRQAALEQLGEALAGGRAIGIGSPRASLESNYALRTLVGAENFYQGVPEQERSLVAQVIDVLQNGPARSPSLHDIASSDAVLVLGEDVSNTAPMIAYALRQSVRQQPIRRVSQQMRIPTWDDYPLREAIQDERGPLFIATPAATRIDDIATGVYRATPQDIARLGFAVAHELDAAAPEVKDLPDDLRELARSIATALRTAERPLVISGVGLGSPELVQAAASAAWALVAAGLPAGLSYVLPESNSMGLGLMGGQSLDQALQDALQDPPGALIVLENDLFRRSLPEQVSALLQSAQTVVVLDSLENPTTDQAGVLLPAATFAEASGSLVNQEGRVQRFYQVFPPQGEVLESWVWLRDALEATERPQEILWANLDALQADLAAALPVFAPLLEVAPPAGFRIAGDKIPRQPARWSGRTAIYADRSVHEPAPPPDPDSPLAFTMEGTPLQPPSALIPRFWAPGWNSIQALNKFQQEIAGALIGGNPGRRLIEPPGAPTAPPNPPAVSGKPYRAVPPAAGPAGAEQSSPQAPEAAQSPQSASPVRPNYFSPAPGAFAPRRGQWLVAPLYHIFGSEELSILTPGVAELAPAPYLGISAQDAPALLGASSAESAPGAEAQTPGLVELTLNGKVFRLPARTVPGLPQGVLGLPVGLPGMPVVALPAVGELAPVDADEPGEEGRSQS